VPLQVIRDGREMSIDVKLGEAPAEAVGDRGQAPDRSRGGSVEGVLEGVSVTDVVEGIRRQLNLPGQLRGGAVVTQIAPTSAAAAAGLREGDVILEINRQKVDSASDAVDLSRQAGGDRVLLRVWSGGGSRYLVVNPRSGR
jgi:serine protease Do